MVTTSSGSLNPPFFSSGRARPDQEKGAYKLPELVVAIAPASEVHVGALGYRGAMASKRRRLKANEVAQMREYREAGYAIVDIARYFQVTVNVVSRVVNYKTHVNVKPEAHRLPPLLTPEEHAARQARTRRAVRGAL